jgi:ATP-dependent Lon protease
VSPVIVHDPTLIEALSAIKQTPNPFVGVFLLKDPGVSLQSEAFQLRSADQIYGIGTLAHIQQLEAGPGGAIAMLMAHRRVRILDVRKGMPLSVNVQHTLQRPLSEVNLSFREVWLITEEDVLCRVCVTGEL